MFRPRPLIVLLILLAALIATGCRKKVKVARPPSIGSTETGIASWYGHPYHGRRAANGEVYDMEKLTAAHRTLPFDTWVRVQNLANDKTVDVRIQDRGPFVKGRIIDLSLAAARRIDLVRPGIVKVSLTVIAPPKHLEAEPELFSVQVGAFRERKRAESLRDSMEARYGDARIVEREGRSTLWRVLVGEEPTEQSAEVLAAKIRQDGAIAFVVRLDQVKPSE
jgi:rare lipoprotein A